MTVPVVTPTRGIDPRTALSTSMHAAPGVYAVLVGSGMSTGAGIPTGWQVVQDLIRRVAKAQGVPDQDMGDRPENWWIGSGYPEPRYDTVLPQIAPTDGMRQAVLAGYFDPPTGQGGPINPTRGHLALAHLCATNRIRVLLTTNFDRLIERALDHAGVRAQVIASPASAKGMLPLVQAQTTLVKLHGDYTMLGLRNTPDELRAYPAAWRKLLAQIFDEFGLIVVGWSADYDVALADALARAPSRRYPLFWTAHNGNLRETARRLIAQKQATVVTVPDADEFFIDLDERIQRLDRIAVRRRRPRATSQWYYMPETSSVRQGWSVAPLLHLRAVALLGPTTVDERGMITPEHRDRLIAVLNRAALVKALRRLARLPAISAFGASNFGVPTTRPALRTWQVARDAFHSGEMCACRLGGDASSGVSAIASVTLPNRSALGGTSNNAVLMLDIGCSLGRALSLYDIATLLRDALVLLTGEGADVFRDCLSPDANPHHAEVHVLASENDGHNQTRPNKLKDRLDLAPLGETTRETSSIHFAFEISSALAGPDAADLLVLGLNEALIDYGYLDPRKGINRLRKRLGIAPDSESP